MTLAAALSFGGAASGWLGCACLVGAVACIAVRRLRETKILPVVLLSMAVAFGSFCMETSRLDAKLEPLEEETVFLTGRLCELPYKQNNRFYYILELERLQTEQGEVLTGLGKIRLSTSNALNLDLYGTLEGKAKVSRPDRNGAFSSRASYQADGISLLGFLYEYEGYAIEPAESHPPYYYALRMRQAMLDSIHSLLPSRQAALLAGVLLGEKNGIDSEVISDFRTVGYSHILSVSGLHMAILSQLMLGMFRVLRFPKRLSTLLAMLGIVCFMALTGFPPSVMRSGLMLLLYLGGGLFRRRTDSVNSLGLAVLLLCMANPYAAADLGLLLSFSATLGILVFPPLAGRFFYRGPAAFLSARLPDAASRRLVPWSYRLWMAMAPSLGAALFSLPICVLAFGEISLIAPVSNLLLMLPSTLLIQIGMAAAVLHLAPVFSFVSLPLGIVTGSLARLVEWMAHILAQIPFASVPSSFDFVGVWLAMSLGILGVAMLLFHRRRVPFLTVSLLSSILLFSGIFSYQLASSSVIRVAVLDVGTGTCVVVSRKGRAALLGCDGYSERVALRYLQSQGISKLDLVHLTGYSNEEMDNAARVLNQLPVEQIVLKADEYLSGALQKNLSKPGAVHYYEKESTVSLWGRVTVSLEDSYEKRGLRLSVDGVEFRLVTDACTVNEDAWWEMDVMIAEGLPEQAGRLRPFFTVLSMEESDHAELEARRWPEVDAAYVTAGKGHLILECQEREITIRRES